VSLKDCLPHDLDRATLLGRVDLGEGPIPVLVRDGLVEDVSRAAPTTSELMNVFAQAADLPRGAPLGPVAGLDILPVWDARREAAGARLRAPVDLQCVRAAGVPFAVSALERVIEERARGDSQKAQEIRDALGERMGGDLRSVKPGSDGAARLKAALIADGLWSQ